MKLVIVVDSSCGLTKKEAEARGWYFLPLFINIDGVEHKDGIDITSKNFFELFKLESVVSTSCSSPLDISTLLDEIVSPDSFVVIYPISKDLSSQYQNAALVAQNFQNVHVIDSKNISTPIIKELVELEKGVKNNEFTIQEGIDIIENKIPRNLNNMVLIPKFNDNLVKGGRLSASAAKIAKLLKIVPMISLRNGKLEKLDKGRIFNKSLIKVATETFNKLNEKNEDWIMIFGHSNNSDKDILMNEISKQVHNTKPFIELFIPPVIAIHTGLEAVTTCFLNLKYDISEYSFDKIKGEV